MEALGVSWSFPSSPVVIATTDLINRSRSTQRWKAVNQFTIPERKFLVKHFFIAASLLVLATPVVIAQTSTWTPDPNQPGYGNFCFGHFNVTAIEKATPNDPSNPTQYTVNYRYEVEGIPAWATTPSSMRAFPKIAADTAIQSASATLVKDPNGGWTVVPRQPAQ